MLFFWIFYDLMSILNSSPYHIYIIFDSVFFVRYVYKGTFSVVTTLVRSRSIAIKLHTSAKMCSSSSKMSSIVIKLKLVRDQTKFCGASNQ